MDHSDLYFDGSIGFWQSEAIKLLMGRVSWISKKLTSIESLKKNIRRTFKEGDRLDVNKNGPIKF